MFSFSLFFSSFLSQFYQVADLRGDNKGQLPLPQGVKASLASLFWKFCGLLKNGNR